MPYDHTSASIPVMAALPVQAFRDLLELVETDFGSLHRRGVCIWPDITQDRHDATALNAVVTVYEITEGTLNDRGTQAFYTGTYVSGGFVQWRRRQD